MKQTPAEETLDYIYDNYDGVRFAFVYITGVDLEQCWAVKGHPLIEHKSGFGNVLRNIADKLDTMYAKRYKKELKGG